MTEIRRRWARILGRVLLGILAVLIAMPMTFRTASCARESQSARAAAAGGRFIQAGDIQIHIQEAGPENGEAVMLMHGIGSWSEIWRETLTALGAAGYHAIAIDVPPFGFSDKPDDASSYSREKQADRILAAARALGLSHVTLVGHSIGSRPTIQAALQDPERVVRLVLVDPALGFQADEHAAPHFEQNAPSAMAEALFSVGPIRNAILSSSGTNPWMTARLFRVFVADASAVTDARTTMLQRPFKVDGFTRACGFWAQQTLMNPDHSLGSDFQNYARLGSRAHFIWGEADTTTPVWQGRALQRLVPGSSLTIIPRVGHIPYIEDPAAFNEALLHALAQNAR